MLWSERGPDCSERRAHGRGVERIDYAAELLLAFKRFAEPCCPCLATVQAGLLHSLLTLVRLDVRPCIRLLVRFRLVFATSSRLQRAPRLEPHLTDYRESR